VVFEWKTYRKAFARDFQSTGRAALNLKVRLTMNSETDVTVFEWTWNCGGKIRKGYGKKNCGKET